MKSLKTILLTAALTMGAFTAMFTSCNPDPCKDVVCNNGGTCLDGTCSCATGFEGTNCDTKMTTKFIKTWTASDLEAGTTTPILYSCIISDNSATTTSNLDVIIAPTFSDDFFVNNINATVSGSTITIASQEPDSDGYKVSGTGTITAAGVISWTYTLTNPSNQTINYTGTWN